MTASFAHKTKIQTYYRKRLATSIRKQTSRFGNNYKWSRCWLPHLRGKCAGPTFLGDTAATTFDASHAPGNSS